MFGGTAPRSAKSVPGIWWIEDLLFEQTTDERSSREAPIGYQLPRSTREFPIASQGRCARTDLCGQIPARAFRLRPGKSVTLHPADPPALRLAPTRLENALLVRDPDAPPGRHRAA